MGKVTESIFSGDKHVIPLADVLFIERDKREGFEGGISVILSGTTWNNEIDTYNNCAYLTGDEAQSFMSDWCRYRAELEADDIMDISGDDFEIFPGTIEQLNNLGA